MRARSALAGVLAVGAALALVELVAGLTARVPSAVDAVGQQLIPWFPTVVEQWAIRTFGTADTAVLNAGTTVVALSVGAVTGLVARRSFAVALAVFAGFGALGVLAGIAAAGAWWPAVVGTLLVAVLLGLGVLRRLLPTAPTELDAAGPDGGLDRRGFLAAATGVAAATVLALATGRFVLRDRLAVVDPGEVTLPAPARALPDVPASAGFDIEGLSPVLTPNDRFYLIDTAISSPQIDPATWQLRIHGAVEREVVLTYDDLLALPLREVDVTLSCVSNEVGGSLVGNARWLGTPLRDLLDRAGVLEGGEQVIGRSEDGFTAGFPTAAVYDGREAMVVVGMNGEPLPVDHGFPARLVVEGLYGYVSATKWLTEIELTSWDVDAYWIPRGWAKEGPIKTQSRIDVPGTGAAVPAGEVVVAGVAWAPGRGIGRVEVQLDGGDWREAELAEPLSEAAWVPWRVALELPAGDHELRVRATDGSGVTQGEEPVPPRPDGAEGWHRVTVRAT